MLQLKLKYREAIIADVELQYKIASSTNKSIETVKRWARENSEYLVMLHVIEIIKQHPKLNIPDSENITEPKEKNILV